MASDIVDLTEEPTDEELEREANFQYANRDASAEPVRETRAVSASAGATSQGILEEDAEVKALSASIAETRDVVRAQQRALHMSTQQLRALETRLERRTKAIVEAADAAIDWVGRSFPWDEAVARALRDIFRISSFRPLQREALNATLSSRDVFAIMPTGAGKSLLFQLASVVDRGLTLVVTPLIALSADQQASLRRLGIRAEVLDSNTSKVDSLRIFDELLPPKSRTATSERPRKRLRAGLAAPASDTMLRERTGSARDWEPDDMSAAILFCTPERIAKSKKLLSRLEIAYEAGHLSRIAIDEAHCCSQWGHDFRSDYLRLSVLRRQCPETPIIALTATCNQRTLESVKDILLIPRCVVFRGTIDRPNLFYEVREKPRDDAGVVQAIADIVQTEFSGKCGIVYVLSRKDAEELAANLMELGVRCGCYHGDMDAYQRAQVYEKWSSGRLFVIVATIAFGLGVDNGKVRYIVHATMAQSLDGYYQESGRAGRDGSRAHCILLYRPHDFIRLSSFVADKGPARVDMLYAVTRYAIGCDDSRGGKQSYVCRRASLAKAFSETPPPRSGADRALCCDVCAGTYGGGNAHTSRKQIVDVSTLAISAVRIVQHFTHQFPDDKLTLIALATDWSNTGAKGKRMRGSEGALDRKVDKGTRLEILIALILEGGLQEFHTYNMYGMNGYITAGVNATAVLRRVMPVRIVVDADVAEVLSR